MRYEFVSFDDLVEAAGACGVKDIWVTPCFHLSPDKDHPIRQHYEAELVATTRLPQGIAVYRRRIAGDYQVKATSVDVARELSSQKLLLAYLINGSHSHGFQFHNGLWTVPDDIEPVKVPPRIPEGESTRRKGKPKEEQIVSRSIHGSA